MKFERFRVKNYRNIIDSGWIDVNQVTAFVGQNEAGKSNLFEALYRVNPIIPNSPYSINEDWPVDKWAEKKSAKGKEVCRVEFSLDEEEITNLFDFAVPKSDSEATDEETEVSTPPLATSLPTKLKLYGTKAYGYLTSFSVDLSEDDEDDLDDDKLQQWAKENIPKFVFIHDYEMSGAQVDLNQLLVRWDQVGRENRHELSHDDQTILIILDLANINIREFIKKGKSRKGRTTRTFDKRQASASLSKDFGKLWGQKEVRFDIEIDGSTLNILAEDVGLGMPVRLNRRSTGFRWYVFFTWKFTHASKGQYKNCILLLEEPGIHLHYSAQRDLLEVFERLSSDNTILYTTHLASMVDLANPERVRIVENRDHHASVKKGVVSSQKGPMAVIEMLLGLTSDMSGLLGNRQTLIVEGGDDALILHKLSGLLKADDKEGLSDRIYLWPACGASKTPMYAAFAIGQKWNAGVLLDTDSEGHAAKKKINERYLSDLSKEDKGRFRVFMLGKAAGIEKTDAAIEDLFPDEFYLECVNAAFGLAITMEDLPVDGSDMVTKRIEVIMQQRDSKEFDKRRVFSEMMKKFDSWKKVSDLPEGTAIKAEKLFKSINGIFDGV